jgi:hypothetical protein
MNTVIGAMFYALSGLDDTRLPPLHDEALAAVEGGAPCVAVASPRGSVCVINLPLSAGSAGFTSANGLSGLPFSSAAPIGDR